MHEFHAWIGLSQSPGEADLGGLRDAVRELRELAAGSRWHDAVFQVRNLNGQYFVTADAMVNRRRQEGERLDLFLAIIARRLPGSWGSSTSVMTRCPALRDPARSGSACWRAER